MELSASHLSGYVRDDGWFVAEKDRDELAEMRASDVPRKFGPIDPIKTDLASPQSRWLYVSCVGFLIWGVVFHWIMFAPAVGLVAFFGRGFIGAVKAQRHGLFTTVRISEIHHEIGETQGVTERVLVDGRAMNVGYRLPVMKALLAHTNEVEVEVLYVTSSKKPCAYASRYRVPVGL